MVTEFNRLANPEMARVWDGDEGDDWTERDELYNAAVAQFNAALFDAAAITTADAILDVGCGTGFTTREAARRAPSGHALGVDLSARMLDHARAAAASDGVGNAEFVQADAQVYPFAGGAFDVAISRFGAMFFADPVAAFANIATAMRRGGRLALVAWQGLGGNTWMTAIRSALSAGRTLPEPVTGQPGPFGLADAGLVRRILTGAGFETVDVTAHRAPVRLGDSVDGALAFVGGMGMTRGLLSDLGEDASARAFEELRSRLGSAATSDGVELDGTAWVITASRR